MPAERKIGMDQSHYSFSSIVSRPAINWPSGAAVAVAVVVLVEHVEFRPPEGTTQVFLPGGLLGTSYPPFPNLPFFAQREYGHRVGIFRVLEVLRNSGIRPTVAIDAMAAERYPYVVERCRDQGAEFVAHGISASRIITNLMAEPDERAYLTDARDRIAAATGVAAVGWMSPEQSESERTPQLVDELGFDYICDWPNDDQPYRMATPRRMVSVPTTHLLEDTSLLWAKPVAPEHYTNQVMAAFRTLAAESGAGGRSLVLVLRPWMSGQPFRIHELDRTLSSIVGSGQVWTATTGEIASAFTHAVPV